MVATGCFCQIDTQESELIGQVDLPFLKQTDIFPHSQKRILISSKQMTGNPPKRPRQHQLETESKRHFESVLPSRWVYRPLDQDYGIDGEIEIFDDSEYATGYKILVQLKATDETDIEKGLRLRLPLSKMKYYKSLDLPVLIVKYHSPSGSLYHRWSHALDPYYTKRTPKALTFQLLPREYMDRHDTKAT